MPAAPCVTILTEMSEAGAPETADMPLAKHVEMPVVPLHVCKPIAVPMERGGERAHGGYRIVVRRQPAQFRKCIARRFDDSQCFSMKQGARTDERDIPGNGIRLCPDGNLGSIHLRALRNDGGCNSRRHVRGVRVCVAGDSRHHERSYDP